MLQKAKQFIMGEGSSLSQKGWDVEKVLAQLSLEEKVSLLSGKDVISILFVVFNGV